MSTYIDNSDFWDDLDLKFILAVRRKRSHLGLLPSSDLNKWEYLDYLNLATPDELENDIMTEQTFSLIST